MDKVYVILAEGFEEIEALTVVDLLRRANVPVILSALADTEEVTGGHGIRIRADEGFSALDADAAELIILPGGKLGADNLEASAPLAELLKKQAAAGKKLAAICGAPPILGKLGLLQGKRATSFPGSEADLLGAEVVDAPAVRDGNLVTARAMGASFDFGLAVIEMLLGKEAAEEMAKRIVYP